jgi:DNA-directed RNA polymerase subunit F
MNIKSSKPVTLTKTKEVLTKRSKDGELGYEQSQALEHADKFCKSDPEKNKKLVDALKKHEKIKDDLAVKIVDVLPSDPATLKAILAKDRIELSDEEVAAIIKDLS